MRSGGKTDQAIRDPESGAIVSSGSVRVSKPAKELAGVLEALPILRMIAKIGGRKTTLPASGLTGLEIAARRTLSARNGPYEINKKLVWYGLHHKHHLYPLLKAKIDSAAAFPPLGAYPSVEARTALRRAYQRTFRDEPWLLLGSGAEPILRFAVG